MSDIFSPGDLVKLPHHDNQSLFMVFHRKQAQSGKFIYGIIKLFSYSENSHSLYPSVRSRLIYPTSSVFGYLYKMNQLDLFFPAVDSLLRTGHVKSLDVISSNLRAHATYSSHYTSYMELADPNKMMRERDKKWESYYLYPRHRDSFSRPDFHPHSTLD